MRKWVISLGGSKIIQKDVDWYFLEAFKELIINSKDKFVIVTGGGTTARKYIRALKKLDKKEKSQSKVGIAITRFHASFLTRIFGKKASKKIPKNMKKIAGLLRKNQIVICGALRWKARQTSDSTAARIAAYLDCKFINMTDVKGLYTSDPDKNKNAKLIKKISWKKFYDLAKKRKYQAGQHFILDQGAAKIILKEKIPTYITNSLKQVKNILSNKQFNGTLIKD
ncbi:MAG: UMP kinase [Candidatus Nanoarchaeia archaeon]